jgi:hypothetical protein
LLSARCDLANLKTSKFSYLPVVKLENYISFFTVKKLLAEQRTEEITKIKNLIESEGESSDTVALYGMAASVGKLITKPKNKVKATESMSKISALEALQKKSWSEYKRSELSVVPEKKFKQELKNLAENKVEGFFLIDEIVDHNNGSKSMGPHVVLLREVHHMSAEVAELLKIGCDHDELLRSGPQVSLLDVEAGRMSYILCNVTSPYIELIMQRFSNMFTRIGVKNPSQTLLDDLLNTHISE